LPDSIFDVRCGRAEERAISAERQELIAGAISCLPAEQREALVLRIFGGLSFAQIAQVVGAPLPTVASRYQRALERLRERLEKLV
jgi:RNA polymerase sigma-70 factor (ECF subfamily)